MSAGGDERGRLRGLDRALGVLSWVVAGALAVMLFVGPVLVAEDEPSANATESVTYGGGDQGESGTTTSADADGAELFSDNCGSCHTLEAAGTDGSIGPSLDGAGLDAAQVAAIVSEGSGSMPSFSDSLDPAQIEAIAQFVAESSGS